MKYRGIFEYEYPTEHKPPVSIDVHLHGDCVKGKIIEWEYRPLEQEPTTKNDLGVDCISRADLIDRCKDVIEHGKPSNDKHSISVETLLAVVQTMPSAMPIRPKALEQEPKTGHWIFDDQCREHGHCSRCGYGSVDLVDGEPHNFCRNCGCRMVEPQESEET